MSGGSMNYICYKVEEAAEGFRRDYPLRKAFSKHLLKVAKALRAIEWNDSGDGDDEEEELIRACISATATLEEAIEQANQAAKDLRNELERANRGIPCK